MKLNPKLPFVAMLFILCCMVLTADAQEFSPPDTGIVICYDGDGHAILCPVPGGLFFGQDAQYDGPEMDYQDNGDGTVTDLNTRLMWQQSDGDEKRLWQDACDYCDALKLAGYSDWRIPSRRELFSIVDMSRYNIAINLEYFVDTKSAWYWSGTTYANRSDDAWGVYFYDGVVGNLDKGFNNYVRCVRSEP